MDDDVIHMMRKLIEKCKSDDFYMYISNEFFNLKEFSSEILYSDSFSCSYGAQDCNNFKNRYKDILPFDKCRVVLNTVDNNEGSDYINASFVNGVEGSYGYIGAQAPLKTTVADFMRMLWQYNIKVIICACNEFEGNKPKCYRYWPNDENEVFNFDKIEVKLLNLEIDNSNEFIKREILLRKTDCDNTNTNNKIEERVITQLHMINWPDHGVPDNIDPIIKMLEISHSRLNETMMLNKKDNQHLLVHCSAGCGRTGTIVALDYCWNLLKSGRLSSDFTPFKIGKMLREQRTAMIQTFDQYKMFYEALEYLFKSYLNSNSIRESVSSDRETNDRISSSSSKKGSGGFKKVLEKIRPSSTSSSKGIPTSSPSVKPSSASTKLRISSSISVKSEIIDANNNIVINKPQDDNLPILYKENTDNKLNGGDYENSIDNFEFKAIPMDRFIINNDIHDVDDKHEIGDDENTNSSDENDTKLISNSVGGVSEFADSIFGKANFKITKLKRNNSLKLENTNESAIAAAARVKQSMSATGSIKCYKPEYIDLKQLNPPLKAQLSNNIHNPSPPVSARSHYEQRLREQTDQLLANRTPPYAPTPPPRNKYKNKNNLLVDTRRDDENENDDDKYYVNDSNETSNNSNIKSNQYISKTEHLV